MPKQMAHPSRGSRSALRHLPNALSLFRLACGPILVAAYWETRPDITFCGMFMLAGLSDGADGYLARRLDLCSVFGAELDGRADTAFYSAMVVVSLRWYATELRPRCRSSSRQSSRIYCSGPSRTQNSGGSLPTTR